MGPVCGVRDECGWVVVWGTADAERVASSVVRQLSFQVRNSPQLAEVLGEGVKPKANWWSEWRV